MQKTQRALLQARSKTIDVAEDVKLKLTTSIETLKYVLSFFIFFSPRNTETFKNISETMGTAFDTFKVCFIFISFFFMWLCW